MILIPSNRTCLSTHDNNVDPNVGRSVLLNAKSFFFKLLFVGFILLTFFLKAGHADVRVRLLLTSNIQGKSIPKVENQDSEDPLLILAQNILVENEKGIDLYLDLGNGFYPGVISKFSYGSIMMDFFDFFGCAATLVSSRDLQIGLQNLEYLQKSRDVHLLSANIRRPAGPVFSPYFLKEIKGIPVAFVGISSKRVEVDISEKNLYDTELADEKETLKVLLDEISASGIKHVVLLSGLKLVTTLDLMENNKQIDMAFCGGDYTGRLYDSNTSRIDLADGRSIVMLDKSFDYYTVDLSLENKISLNTVHSHKALRQKSMNEKYIAFANRLALWKDKYMTEQNKQITQIDEKEYLLDDQRLMQLMRDRYNSEIAIVENDTITSYPITGDIIQSDLLHLVNLDYNIFTFKLSGDQIAKVVAQQYESDIALAGLSKNENITIQGYPIEAKRAYSVAATQPVYRKIRRLLDTDIDYINSWTTVTDLFTQDFETEKITLRNDYTYLDRRYRALVDFYLSNSIASGNVERGQNIETPVSQPAKDYSKWAFEDKIDMVLYNQYHRFVFTPYVFYSRQNDTYYQNLLRGTFLYEYNLFEKIRPYNKFQCDSVVDKVDDMRPVLIRETIGGSLYGEHISGKIGLGFEKKVQDPADNFLYGFEAIVSVTYPFFKYYTYTFDIDNFVSSKDPANSQWELRTQISNTLSMRINTFLSISLKHKFFYLHEVELNEEYRNSQILTTFDLLTDWKLW